MFNHEGQGAAIDNGTAARTLFGVASLLESLGANPYRVRTYRRAAVGMLFLPEGAARYLNDEGELVLPWLGERLRRKLGELVREGKMQFHDDLLADLPRPFRELLAVPGIGPKTATRLLAELRLGGLADLAVAAREGRLQTLRGIGPVRERRWGEAAEALLQDAREAA